MKYFGTLFFSLAAVFASAQKIDLPNAGFESENANYHGALFEITKENPHFGEKALKHVSKTLQMKPPYIEVKPNAWYRIRLWNRNTVKNGQVKFGIRQCTLTDPRTTKSVLYNWFDLEKGSGDWKEYTADFKTSRETRALSLYFKLDDNPAGESFYDDISIEEIPAPEKVSGALEVSNPGFENGDNYRGGMHETTSANPHSGKKALKHIGKTIQMVPPYIEVKPDTWYRITIWNRTTAMTGDVQFGIRQCFTARPDTKSVLYNWFDVKTNQLEWIKIEKTFKTTSKTNGISIYFRMSDDVSGGEAFYDDISITEFVPEKPLVMLDSYKPVATFIEGENLLMLRMKGEKNRWEYFSPDREKLTVRFDREAIGKTVSVKLSERHDGKTYFTKEFDVPETLEAAFALPVSSLPEGKYILSVMLKINGSTVRSLTKDIIRMPRMDYAAEKLEPIRETSCDSDGNFLVNGKKFFPIYYSHYFYNTETAPALKSQLGANLISSWADIRWKYKKPLAEIAEKELTGYYISEYGRQASEIGKGNFYSAPAMGMIGISSKGKYNGKILDCIAGKLADDSSIFSWNIVDEPDIHDQSPALMKGVYKSVKKVLPRRIAWINLCNPEFFTDYSAASEIAAYDFYPIPNESLMAFMKRTEKLKSAFRPGTPMISYLQAYNPQGIRLPTYDEFRTAMYLNMIAGVKSMYVYSFTDPPPVQCLITDAELQGYVKAVVGEFWRMRDFMGSTSCHQPDFKFGIGVYYLYKKVGNGSILIVSNVSGGGVTLKWKLPGVRNESELRFERRRISARDGVFSDVITNNDTHVYRFENK